LKRVAVIPARGGSKRIPNKNIRLFCGKPILAYTIQAARDSGLFEKIIVTTDSTEIADVAREYAAQVPFLREAQLADDHTPVAQATVDALARLEAEGDRFEAVAQLMANCPLRDAGDIVASWNHFARSGARFQITIAPYLLQNPAWAVMRGMDGRLSPVFNEHFSTRSQDLPPVFCPSGAIWWAQTSALRETKSFHTSATIGWEIAWEHGLDIDTPDDWRVAETLASMTQGENQ
jgi:N-acylneuraminate cytidylyltransferase